jgi:hypothetical protein
MYVGHFAIAVALKARKPQVAAAPIFVGVVLLDLLYGLFVMTGLDRVTADLTAGPYLYFKLNFMDWDHSLLAAVVWSLVWGALFLKKGRDVATVAALAVFSHFVADWPMHNRDLALYPYSVQHLGLGLWGQLGTGAWLLEGAFAAALGAYAWVLYARRGVSMLWPSVMLGALFLNLSPWTSPMKLAAAQSEPTAHLLHGALVTLGFVLPNALLMWLMARAEARARVGRALNT